MGMEASVRRNVDARLVSYALSVLEEAEATPELRSTFRGCVTAAVQAASGLVALKMACRAASGSPMLGRALSGGQLRRVQTLLDGLASTIEESWQADVKELLEVVVVLACHMAEDDREEMFYRQLAQGVTLDTRDLAMVDDKVTPDIEEDQAPAPKRSRVRKPRSSKDLYQKERLENLVARAIAQGVVDMRATMIGGTIVVLGTDAKKIEQRLLKVRGSMADAEELCEKAMAEIHRMDAVENVM